MNEKLNWPRMFWVAGIITIVIWCVMGLFSAKAQTPLKVYLPLVTREHYTSLIGNVFSIPLNQPLVGLAVNLAQVYCGGYPYSCIWVLSIPGSPGVWTGADGIFEFYNLEYEEFENNSDIVPGAYVIILGFIQDSQPDESGRYCTDDACEIVPGIWQTTSGEILDVGQLNTYKNLPIYIPPNVVNHSRYWEKVTDGYSKKE